MDTLIEKARQEIRGLSPEAKAQLAGGFDNRGLDCISQRWYGPDEMRGNSALWSLGALILQVEDLLRDELSQFME